MGPTQWVVNVQALLVPSKARSYVRSIRSLASLFLVVRLWIAWVCSTDFHVTAENRRHVPPNVLPTAPLCSRTFALGFCMPLGKLGKNVLHGGL